MAIPRETSSSGCVLPNLSQNSVIVFLYPSTRLEYSANIDRSPVLVHGSCASLRSLTLQKLAVGTVEQSICTTSTYSEPVLEQETTHILTLLVHCAGRVF